LICHLFFSWYFTDNVCIYINSVHDLSGYRNVYFMSFSVILEFILCVCVCFASLFCHFWTFLSTENVFTLSKFCWRRNIQTYFSQHLGGAEKIMHSWTDPCSHIPAQVEIPHSWRLVWYTLPVSWKSLKGEGSYCSKQVFANQYSSLVKSKSLVIKSCSKFINHSTICTRWYGHSDCSGHIFGQWNRGKACIYGMKANFSCLSSNITCLPGERCDSL
jgi:hypothetical protein